MTELNIDTIINRDALYALRELPEESVHCCVTSPPYYALRDYGLDAQIGREDTPEQYIDRLTEVFREVRRVLRTDGTFWLNIADTYCGTGNKGYHADPKNPRGRNGQAVSIARQAAGCKQKDLIGIPWLLAFALRADGWYLRSDIIWQKENPMPESVKDRPTRCYEHIFLLTKSKKYFYDAAAIAEPLAPTTAARDRPGGAPPPSRRIPEKSVAENLLEACRREMVATIQRITRKEKSENPPPLYDLTTLQRDANRLLGYSAQQTLDYVQSLYEKKLTTYPRTDSCYITDDDEEMLEVLTEELEGFFDITPEDVDEAVPRTRRTVNREKVTDHHAILPTRSMLQADLEALPKGEQNVLKLIIARTLMAVSKPFRYLETLLTTECAGEEFTAKGKEVLEEGWKAVERKVLADILNRKQELTALPNAAENECGILNAELKEGQTSPPKHFTEDTLLHAMETASADSMPEGVERQGIGTPATRAATIEKLVQKGFLERKGNKKTKVLLPTDKGKALITVMPEEMQSADMTADWEAKLLQIERGEMESETFMTEIKEMISSLVTTTEAAKGANALMKNKIIGVCPNCGKSVVEREKGWFCENRECRFVLWKDNAFFKRLGKRLDAHVADKLLRDGRVRLKDCKSAKGKTYNATVLLSCEADGRSKFSLEFEGGC